LAPGFSPGALTISGDLNLNANSVLNIELGGDTQGSGYDYIKVNGVAALNGTLNVGSYDGFSPAAGSTFTVMNFASTTGAFISTTQPAGWNLSFVPGASSYSLQAASVAPALVAFTASSPVALNMVVAEVSMPAPLEVLLERTVETVTVMDTTPPPVQKFVSVKKVIEEEACQ
jgi:outer membrane autotransporter protein